MNEYLTPIESIMWRVGQDATLRMTVGAVDAARSVAGRSRRSESTFRALADDTPRLRQRPDDPTYTRLRPAWVDDEHDIEQHVRSIAIASPGSMRQLLDLVGLLEAVPFDPERPPWDVTLIEGLENGRAALFFRAHHVVTDGIGGIRLAGALLDEPGWPAGASRRGPARRDAGTRPSRGTRRHDRRRGTITIDLTKATRPVRQGAHFAREVATLDSVVRGIQRGLDVANSVSRQVMVTGGPLSPLFEDHSMMSRFEILSVPRARQSSRELGGSRNDLLVAAAARGLGLYHERMGEPTSVLRLATPAGQGRGPQRGRQLVRTRARRDSRRGSNARTAVPHGCRSPRAGPQRTRAAARDRARLDDQPHALTDAAAGAARAGGFGRLRGDDRPGTAIALVTSAVRASRRRIPFGPRLGCPLNITALGNDDRLDVGVALDPAAITDPDVFLQSLTEAFEMFGRAARAGLSAASDPVDEAVH